MQPQSRTRIPQREGGEKVGKGPEIFYGFPMGPVQRRIAGAVVTLGMLSACAAPSTPSVGRQAASLTPPPLTITADVVEPSTGEPAPLALAVSVPENADWDGEQRPDSRVRGFHDVVLTPADPSLTRTFSVNAAQSEITFDLASSVVTNPPRNASMTVQLIYRTTGGWHIAIAGTEPVAFGAGALEAASPIGSLRLITTANPAELRITNHQG